MLRFSTAKAVQSVIALAAVLLTSAAHAHYSQLQECLTGPAAAYADPSCSDIDFDHDGDVDLHDFGRFQASCPGVVGNECADDLDCNDGDDMTLDECVRCGSESVCENTEVPGYRQYFTDNPTVKAASIDQFDFPTLNKFWEFARELERAGSFRLDPPEAMQDCGAGDLCPQIILWGDESVTYPAARIAHNIWTDKNTKFPWQLEDNTFADLDMLFFEDLDVLFDNYMMTYIINHSYSEIYAYAQDEGLIQQDVLSTLYAVIGDLHDDFCHGAGNSPYHNVSSTLLHALTYYTQYGCRIARNGCHSMSPIATGVLRALNIPGEVNYDWGNGHASAEWSVVELVLGVGDDIYAGTLDMTPAEKVLVPYSWYYDVPDPGPCPEDGSNRYCLSRRHTLLNGITYGSTRVNRECCRTWGEPPDCYAILDDWRTDQYGQVCLTDQELLDWVQEVLSLCD